MQESLSSNDPALHQRLGEIAGRFGGGSEGMDGAYRMLAATIQREALIMSFSDIFVVMAFFSVIILPLLLLLRPIDPERAQSVGAH